MNQLRNNYKATNLKYIQYNNKTLTTPAEIAEAFNDYYVNIAPQLDNNIPSSDIDPLSFLTGNYPTSMAIPPVVPQDVINIINSLKTKKKKEPT